jgi:hypothetical protein
VLEVNPAREGLQVREINSSNPKSVSSKSQSTLALGLALANSATDMSWTNWCWN